MLYPDVAKSLPTGQRLSNVRTQQKKNSIGPILFIYYEDILVSSNLNSKQLRFHGVRPNLYTYLSILHTKTYSSKSLFDEPICK